MNWLYYLLEANLYLLLFYGFYRLFLQNETFYNSNRYFLLLSSVTAFVLPIMQLGFLKPTPIIDNNLFPPPILYTEEQLAKMTFAPVQETFNLIEWFYPVYLIIALGFAIKLSISLFKIIHLCLKAKKAKTGKITLIELKEQTTAFSFFNLLFIHPHLAEKQTVLNHEMVHIKQKHSVDILFFELLQIICWFNPIIHFIKKDIKLLHEYIADELSTNSGIQKHEYAMFLIENSFGVVPIPLTNQIFNQSILKRRINMLNKKRTADWARLRLLLTLPLVGAMLCTSTMAFTKDYGYVDLLPEKSKTAETIPQEVPQVKEVKQTAPKVKTVKRDQVKFPPPIVSQAYYSPSKYDKSTKKQTSLENKLIIVNGKELTYKNDFYGVSGADKIITLKSAEAIKKYGDKAKYGVVEVSGKSLKIINTPTDKIKFPPPIVRPDRAYFIPKRDYNSSSTNPPYIEKRYVVMNGQPVSNLDEFYGVRNASQIIYLKPSAAVSKYGDKAKNGAVEITGGEVKYLKLGEVPPPPPVEDQVKFPPPIVKPDKKSLKSAPAPPPAYKVREKAPRVTENRNITGTIKREIDSAANRLTGTVRGYQVDRKNNINRVKSLDGKDEVIAIEGYPINDDGTKINEVELKKKGNQSKKSPILTEGYPINTNGEKIKEVKVTGRHSKVN
ncbi:M56 family metallopeptidase [Pedobacter frigiditerrae]|uniref:M56 family metallopeptidase n=1 Tax=Pedobacter frigiditerrae TaxID=2530452 RepID=A0A4R0MR25_9SPHI|nr:M56 family metallopeptidase [Pedobacter frigiditerrae]TCC89338.1 M56 family metallopeptidase [Pedobacter frigiditerrae]